MPRIRVGRSHEYGARYIGRGSPLGNPFVIGRDGNRDEVCDKYEQHFRYRVRTRDPEFMAALNDLLERARSGSELVLGCFCAPRRCHGDTIKRWLEEQLAEKD